MEQMCCLTGESCSCKGQSVPWFSFALNAMFIVFRQKEGRLGFAVTEIAAGTIDLQDGAAGRGQ
jgi:hypothetical protein